MSDQDLFDVSGRVACVTGASSGIGRAAATMLAACGARVVGVARRQDALDEWSAAAAGETATVAADLLQRDRIEHIARAIQEPFGAPDILVNAAGINTRQKADDVTSEGWDLTIELNLAAPFFLAQALVPEMKRRRWGRIVNLASLQSRRAFAGGLSYGASKGGGGTVDASDGRGMVERRRRGQRIGAGVFSNGVDRTRFFGCQHRP